MHETVSTFGELIKSGALSVTDGYRAKNSELGGDGLIFLRAGHVTDTHIDFDGVERFHTKLESKLQEKASRVGDVIVTTKGNSTGRTSFVDSSMPTFVYSPHLSRWRVEDEKRIDSCFLRYWSRSSQFVNQMRGLSASTDMAPYLSLRDQQRLEITLPHIDTQRAIGSLLGALDDKIEHNRKTSRALEGLARAMFKAWFVDFEPVKAKAAGATSFPGMPAAAFAALPTRFVDSELGPVPEGWGVRLPGDLASFVLGGDWGTDSATNEAPAAACCIRGADIPDLWANGLGKMPVRFLKFGSLEKRSLRDGDIVVEISGGSPTQSTGRPVLVRESILSELPHPLVCSNFCRIFRPQPGFSIYVYFLFRWMYDAEQFLQYENGTTGIKNFAFTKFCEVHSVIEPSKAVLSSFEAAIVPLLDQMAQSGRESRKLAELRDYLLPKLLSGEVRVGQAAQSTAGVA